MIATYTMLIETPAPRLAIVRATVSARTVEGAVREAKGLVRDFSRSCKPLDAFTVVSGSLERVALS